MTEEGPKIGDGSGDAALFIAEEAFRAGWNARAFHAPPMANPESACERAWSEFEPSETAKEMS